MMTSTAMFPPPKVDTADASSETVEEVFTAVPTNATTVVRVPVKHANLGIRSHAMDMSTMVELTSFSTLGKIQPFLVTISTSAAVVVDLHCHLMDKEVCGYLGGHWDINAHNLAITSAFPCRYAGKDKTSANMVEAEISKAMEWQRVTLVGWYHSHPRSHASPSLRDVDSQLDYQIRMKGPSDNGYTPCIGLICSPYNADGNCYESNFNVFWSMPPPENRPHEYPRPMLLSYTLAQEPFISQDGLDEIKKCIDYYRSEGGIDFRTNFNPTTTYLERLKNSLASKLPGPNRTNGSYWDIIREMICPGLEPPEPPPEGFVAVQFPQLGISEAMAQAGGVLPPNNVFLAPVNFKPENAMVASVAKPFGIQPSTSTQNNCNKKEITEVTASSPLQMKDSRGCMGKMNRPEIIPTFRSGELTVSVKNAKMDFEPSPTDFTKLATPLTAEALNNMRSNLPADFPLADLSQPITGIPDLSKLTSFTPADLAKLSGFSLSEFTKASSTAYARNIANLFGPIGKCPPTDLTICNERKMSEFISEPSMPSNYSSSQPTEMTGRSEDMTMNSNKKGMDGSLELTKPNRPTTDFTTAEELSISSVRPDFGAMLDMTTNLKKQQQSQMLNDSGESLNLSKDRQ
ncbi:MPN domain-containing protein CG4751 [Venturia canescens]|uniref:MPN domain-containing protein CG4751 n=1 Tax=Venturia canescens TaxID=32260 RepID=UPI001C9D3FBD|nr:MPN domain-containing protein CG4751 [Venturia canescens]